MPNRDHYGRQSDCPEAADNANYERDEREARSKGGAGVELIQPPRLEEKTMKDFIFFGTFGSGQRGYPGYYKITVKAVSRDEGRFKARQRMADATDNRWCGMYDSLQAMHEGDRIYRGCLGET